MRSVSRRDALVAAGFVLAAAAEAVARYHGSPGLLAFNASGALWLGFLAVRRRRPVVAIAAITIGALLGTLVTEAVWPDAGDGGGVWIAAMLLASYSIGAHGSRRVLALGVLLPLAVVMAADVTTMSGWAMLSGILFISLFVGLLPTVAGRLVRIRGERLRLLRDQHERIVRAQRSQQESAVLAERLQTAERLQPTLVEGLRTLAVEAESGRGPGEIESSARVLLARTRTEVLALTAPVAEQPVPDVPPVDSVAALRAAAQPWVVLAAGAVVVGLSVESSTVLRLSAPGWLVLPAAVVVGIPFALAWWRPLVAVSLGWVAVTCFSRLVAPLDGSLSESGVALTAAFAVAALSARRGALAGLALCLLGQTVGVAAADPLGEGVFVVLAWLGGLAVGEVSRLVEQTRANTELLRRQEGLAAARAVVDERLRLARELHDAVGHSLTVVALQAGAARRLAGTDPSRVPEVMRTVAAAARDGVASLTIDPAGADIAALIERVRETGLVVDAELTDAVLLAAEQRIIAYRVVQEALTNVLRHAPGSRAAVRIRGRGSEVEVAVTNTAPTAPGSGPGTGRGLEGVQERAREGQGAVTWTTADDGGFEVRALLPMATLAVPAS